MLTEAISDSERSSGIDRPIRVIVADDHRIVREGICALLRSEPSVELAAEASGGQELLTLLEDPPGNVVLLDARLPDLYGLWVLREMQQRGMTTPVVVLSMFEDPSHVKRAIELGASGYLLRSVGRAELLKALRAVVGGGCYIQGEITAPLIAHVVDPTADAAGDLSRTDVSILEMLAAGLDNRAMANRMGVSESALKAHLRSIYARLNVKRRSEAVASAMRLDIIS